MAEIICIINQKGGVGKSTTADALAAGLTLKGFKVLSVDLDAQRNLTRAYGADRTEGATSLELLEKKATAQAAVQHTRRGDLIPASRSMNDFILTEAAFKEYRLKEGLEQIRADYDYIILDTPPALSLLTINALTACDSVIIPAQAAVYSLQALEDMASTLEAVRTYSNANLKVRGILLTIYDGRAILSRDLAEAAEMAAQALNTTAFKTRIRRGIAIGEAQAYQQSIFEYAPASNAAKDYAAFIEELLL